MFAKIQHRRTLIADAHRGWKRPIGKCLLAAFAYAIGLLQVSSTVADTGPSRERAVWERHSIRARLRNLPKQYSCKELEGKFRDVLEQLGARSLEIQASRCESALGPAARSPQVRVEFEQLRTIKGTTAQSEDIEAASKTVRIAPGDSTSLKEPDCKLLKQMLDVLPGEPIKYNLACMVRPVGVSFYVVMKVLVPALPDPTQTVAISERDR